MTRLRQVSRSLPPYYLSPLVTKASVLVLAAAATGRSFVGETPPMSREAFWQFQLGPDADLYCRRWSRPRVLLARLEKVARHCRESVLDYDVPGPLTADARNFDDPQHFNAAVARELARGVVEALAGSTDAP